MIRGRALETAVDELGKDLPAQPIQVELAMSTNENHGSRAWRTDIAAQGTQSL
jgi:hypothetical protein